MSVEGDRFRRRLASVELLTTAIVSVFRDPPQRPGARRRAEYHCNAIGPRAAEPGNVAPAVTAGMIDRSRGAVAEAKPYWLTQARYDLLEVVGTAIELLDQHDAALPTTVLPPESDVLRFVETVGARARPVDVVAQLEIALPIARGELEGAVNLCWIATRLMARGADRRAYPGVPVTAEALAAWSRSVAGFVEPSPANGWTCDAAGDTYYFWTHVLIELLCHERGWPGAGVRAVFAHGTGIMRFVRGVVVGQTIVSDHREASRLGRLVGRGLLDARRTDDENRGALATRPARGEASRADVGLGIASVHQLGQLAIAAMAAWGR